ncbi:hypothetical protein CK203_087855 [Vitis vinifera]|uniref:Uncharacterized protein n=1 Tax=Vitis vinifera TaxID=29760 RepID=A0A438E438_VITVI|nr:hypothetical protein CK203_087855 [Vitis vinifera]
MKMMGLVLLEARPSVAPTWPHSRRELRLRLPAPLGQGLLSIEHALSPDVQGPLFSQPLMMPLQMESICFSLSVGANMTYGKSRIIQSSHNHRSVSCGGQEHHCSLGHGE